MTREPNDSNLHGALVGIEPDETLRIGLIGAGHISAFHLAAWQKVADAEVVAVCDTDRQRAQERADAFGVANVYGDAAEMLDRERLHAVDIATWRETHASLVLLAARYGVHALCQKPLTPSLAQSQALVAELDGRVRLMVHENRRFSPYFRTIREWIDAGRLGALRQCQMIMLRSGFLKDENGLRPAVEQAPYMAKERELLVAETLIHQLDVLRWLIGPLHVVAARLARTEEDMPGETMATILLETERNAPIVLAGSFIAPGFGTAVTDRLELIGERATVLLEGDRLRLMDQSGIQEDTTFDQKAAYQTCFDAAIAHFALCLRSGAEFETAPSDNLETLKLVQAIYAVSSEVGD